MSLTAYWNSTLCPGCSTNSLSALRQTTRVYLPFQCLFFLFSLSVSDSSQGRRLCNRPRLQPRLWLYCQSYMWREGGEHGRWKHTQKKIFIFLCRCCNPPYHIVVTINTSIALGLFCPLKFLLYISCYLLLLLSCLPTAFKFSVFYLCHLYLCLLSSKSICNGSYIFAFFPFAPLLSSIRSLMWRLVQRKLHACRTCASPPSLCTLATRTWAWP